MEEDEHSTQSATANRQRWLGQTLTPHTAVPVVLLLTPSSKVPQTSIPGGCGGETRRGESKRFPETKAPRGMHKRRGSIAALPRASRLPGSAIINRGVSSLLIASVAARAKGSQSVSEKGLISSLRLCQQHCLVQKAAEGSFFIHSLCMDHFFSEERDEGLVFGWVISNTQWSWQNLRGYLS